MPDKTIELTSKLISNINSAPAIVVIGLAVAGLVIYKNTPKKNETI